MKNELSNTDAELLLILQQGIPLESRPFTLIGQNLGISEEQVIEKALSLIKNGLVRRFGAVFEAHQLGYSSTLCAVDIPEGKLEHLAAAIIPHPGITHCYERNNHPNLWFTMTAPEEELTAELDNVSKLLAPFELSSFPARRTFKIGVVLDVRHDGQSRKRQNLESVRTTEIAMTARKFNDTERALIRILQGNIPLSSPDPLQPVAKELGIGYKELLSTLAIWKKNRIIRRLGFIPNHREIGFAVNAMCAWKVDSGKVEEAGNNLARSPSVTHCYERIVNAVFPYNLFAMVHARTHDEILKLRDQLAVQAGISNGCMMLSVREFKKSSPVFFG